MKTIYKKLFLFLLLFPLSVLAQSKVSGVVVDKTTNLSLPGVNIVIEGTSTGTSTGSNGEFQLTNLKPGDKIIFSYLGYRNQEIIFSSQKDLSVALEEDSTQLNEVTVQVGYGSVKKKDATGAVTTLSAKDFNKGLNNTPETLIQGRMSGVQVTTGGAPGAKSNIIIRGGSSLNASNEPLIVVDGLPLSNATPGGGTSFLATMDPNDIETFTVLKDASAAAIYGSRAANGVIVITTKKGTKGEVKVNFNSQTGINTIAKKVDVLSADEFRALVNEKGTLEQIATLGDANTDWQDEIFATSITSTNNLSASGMIANVLPTRIAVGNTVVDGVLMGTSMERTTVNLSLNPTFLDNHLKVNLTGNLAFGKGKFQDEGNVIGSAISFDPTQSPYAEGSRYGGYFEWLESNGNVNLLPAKNPLARINQTDNRSTSTTKTGNLNLDYKFHFLEELRAVVDFGINRYDGSGSTTISDESINGYQPLPFSSGNWVNYGNYSYYTDTRQNTNFNGYLAYDNNFNKFNVSATAGYNYQLFQREGFVSGETRQPNPAADVQTDADVNLQSFFGRVNLGFDSRYLLTINYRYDGTSRFSEENRWGNFWGGAFAWNVTNEAFLKDNRILSNLKLRVGYGTTGQQDIDAAYDYLQRVTKGTVRSQYIFGNVIYPVVRAQGYNENIKWEEITETNVGLDYGFFNNLITGSVNYFYKEANDLLARVPYPDGANLRNEGFANIGEVVTKGLEFSIESDIIKTQDWRWNVAYNQTYIDQKVTSLGEQVAGFQGYSTGAITGGSDNQIQITSVDYAQRTFFVLQQLYDDSGRPIQGAYVDRNGDGKIGQEDRYQFHKAAPDFTFGLNTSVNYKQFDFSANCTAATGNYIFDNISSDKGYLDAGLRRNSDLANITSDYYNTGFTTEDNGTLRYLSDYFVKDASYIKINNITFGYTMDKSVLKYLTLRLSAGVQNAAVFTKYNGVDPEQFSGIDGNIYPRARTFLLGLNANF